MSDTALVTAFALTRAVHFAACLLAFGWIFFDRIVSDERDDAPRPAEWLLAGIVLASGAAWLALAAAAMSDEPAFRWPVIVTVWRQTRFGTLWQLRSAVLGFCVLTLLARRFVLLPLLSSWLGLAASAGLAGTLAWAGHGLHGGDDPIHLPMDVLHIVASGVWPAGLVPFVFRLRSLRREAGPASFPQVARLTRRFSACSLAAVACLALSGIWNSRALVGSWADLVGSDYGRVLLAKIALFALAVALGAVNLLRLKPRVCGPAAERIPPALRRLYANVWLETFLSAAVLILVGWLGRMEPPVM